MTREEAIKQLKMDRDLANFNPMTGEETPMNEDCRKSVEALNVAIKALEKQPRIVTCKDCKYNYEETCDIDGLVVCDDYFCANGKRKQA